MIRGKIFKKIYRLQIYLPLKQFQKYLKEKLIQLKQNKTAKKKKDSQLELGTLKILSKQLIKQIH